MSEPFRPTRAIFHRSATGETQEYAIRWRKMPTLTNRRPVEGNPSQFTYDVTFRERPTFTLIK